VRCRSDIIKWNQNYEVDPSAEEVTGLCNEFCEGSRGLSAWSAFRNFITAVDQADFLAGQNAILFDKPMVLSNVNRINHETIDYLIFDQFKKTSHLDTYFD